MKKKRRITDHLCNNCKNKKKCIYAKQPGNVFSCKLFVPKEVNRNENDFNQSDEG